MGLGILCIIFEDFAGDSPGGFMWALFSNEEKLLATKTVTNLAAQKNLNCKSRRMANTMFISKGWP